VTTKKSLKTLNGVVQEEGRTRGQKVSSHDLRRESLPQEPQIATMQGQNFIFLTHYRK